jgi:hypothetical protein
MYVALLTNRKTAVSWQSSCTQIQNVDVLVYNDTFALLYLQYYIVSSCNTVIDTPSLIHPICENLKTFLKGCFLLKSFSLHISGYMAIIKC